MDTTVSRRALVLGALPAACGLAASPTQVATIAGMRGMASARLTDRQTLKVLDTLRGGRFRWHAASRDRPDGGTVFSPLDGGNGRWLRVYAGSIDAGWFGASPRSSAATNTAAFCQAGQLLAERGGRLVVRPGVYMVGAQKLAGKRGKGMAFEPEPILQIDGAAKPVRIDGRGAVLKCARGLRYGQFDPVTGDASEDSPIDVDHRATPYSYMIDVRNCSANVTIDGFELDGSIGDHELGGLWGDRGRQLPASGVGLIANTAAVEVANLWSHHHALDGVIVEHSALTERSPLYPVRLANVRSEFNARQGLSWVGGNSLTATGCQFSHTGRARFSSSPAAGMDMEAEGSVCRNGRFVECEFIDNVGAGFVADSGDGADALFERCTFVGTSYFPLWPRKPRLRFHDCLIVGTLVNTFSSPDPALATQFLRCRFTNEQSLSPSGAVYHGTLADLGGGANKVRFVACSFEAVGPSGVLPWSPVDTRYEDCIFEQQGAQTSYTRGVFIGRSSFTTAGSVNFDGSVFEGQVVVNGKRVA